MGQQMKYWLRRTADSLVKRALRPLGLELRRSGIRHFPEATSEEAAYLNVDQFRKNLSTERQG
jgi:hypothetical protein